MYEVTNTALPSTGLRGVEKMAEKMAWTKSTAESEIKAVKDKKKRKAPVITATVALLLYYTMSYSYVALLLT